MKDSPLERAYVCAFVRLRVCMWWCARACVCVCAYTVCGLACVCVDVRVSADMWVGGWMLMFMSASAVSVLIQKYVNLCVCVCAYFCVFVCMYVCVCVRACLHVCARMCVYIKRESEREREREKERERERERERLMDVHVSICRCISFVSNHTHRHADKRTHTHELHTTYHTPCTTLTNAHDARTRTMHTN